MGCSADAREVAEIVGGDDIGFRAAIAPILGGSETEFSVHVMPNIGAVLARFAALDSPCRCC